MLTLTFKGHVVAPTFKFSAEIIDFGRVSYKFPIQKSVYLTNTSEVDINYVVRVPGDGRSQSEFHISNDHKWIEKSIEAKIDIEFVPSFPQQYDMVLVVDLEGVGQDMLAVPIKAEKEEEDDDNKAGGKDGKKKKKLNKDKQSSLELVSKPYIGLMFISMGYRKINDR